MKAAAWRKLNTCLPEAQTTPWLETMLKRNENCVYLNQWGRPSCRKSYRSQVPLSDYEQLKPWIDRIAAGEPSVLFSGEPVAFETTGGSSGGCKLIPYSAEGLLDFRRVLLPWLSDLATRHHIKGSAYFSLSPICRKQEYIAGVPVGLSDTAYVGEKAGTLFASVSAVPVSVGALLDHDIWKAETSRHLKRARDLELISAWSPTFLLKLFETADTETLWPDLKVISCWTGGASAVFAKDMQRLFPHAAIEPKGLMSTEAAITVPDEQGQIVLADTGFFEFRDADQIFLEHELKTGRAYEVIITTASGLYRYCTGDMVRYMGHNHAERAILDFIGRQGLISDLVGEKLTESFVSSCLKDVGGFHMLVPRTTGNGYVLVLDREAGEIDMETIETRLMGNPQYAYARKLGQLMPLTILPARHPWGCYERYWAKQGVRLGDIKPVMLRSEWHWECLFRTQG
ncbi:MAG: GH3 auxin-responsive promoter family protein [Mariprofundaceae bacterium]